MTEILKMRIYIVCHGTHFKIKKKEERKKENVAIPAVHAA